jgi:hypothetical protein
MREWRRTDLPGSAQAQYDLRRNHLRGTIGGGLNGTVRLNSTTVRDDAAADVLTGGLDLDWFWSYHGDLITDLNTPPWERNR